MGCDTTRFPPVPVAPEPDPTGVSRRTVLRVGSGGALAVVIGVLAGRRLDGDDDPAAVPNSVDPTPSTSTSTSPSTTTTTTTTTAAAPVFIPEIGDVDTGIVALGRRVLETGGGSDLATLLALLPSGAGDPIEQAATVVRAEFLDGDTIVVDGWVLAASEARAAAVVALLCENSPC
jgi:hypothetical protein